MRIFLRAGFFGLVAAAVFITGSGVLASDATQSIQQTFDHSAWERVLKRFVNEEGLVDYEGLAKNREDLNTYIKQIETSGPETTPELFADRNHALAYYINGYNALVFAGVLSRGPEDTSVWSGLISGYRFFTWMDVVIDGSKTNLSSLENDIIRRRFTDPRIHAAINCASIGCPRLPQTPFIGSILDEQLETAMKEFVLDSRHVQPRGDRVYVSRIFDWFEEDFVSRERSLLDYINHFRGADNQIEQDAKVQYLKYDKSINKQ